MEVGKYALARNTKDVLAKFSKQHTKYTFKRTSINSWKTFKNNRNSQNLKKIGRPNLLSEELLKRTKDVIIGSRLAGTVISRRMVIVIGTGVVKTNHPGTIVQMYFFCKYLYGVNNYTDYRNFSIISGATKILADL